MEISEIKKSELNREFRIDAEYFAKSYLERHKILEAFGTVIVGDCVTDGIHTSIDYDENSPVNLLSATSPRDNYVDLSRGAKISISAHKANPRTAVKVGDVLVSTVGTIGNSAVVDESVLPANTDRHIGIIRKPNYSPYLISTFLLSKFGRGQTLRETTGNVQQNLFLYKIREILLPDFSETFQGRVESIVKNGYSKRTQASEIYKKAEDALLSELALADYTPTDESVSVRKFSDFMAVKRLDAEYYQLKYDDIVGMIGAYHNGTVTADTILVSGLEKVVDGQIEKYVELADIGSAGEITGCTSAAFEELPSRARQRVRRGDVIVSSIEGSLQSCALIGNDFDGALCSTGFHRFRSADINPETLLLLFKSLPIQSLMKRGCSGTILCGILPGEFSNIRLPKITVAVQAKLADMVQRSFAARKESSRLLDLAKLAVETAIENGEAEGLKLLVPEQTVQNESPEESDYDDRMAAFEEKDGDAW